MATERASRIPAQTMFDALVVESIVETPDTRTLVLDVGPHPPYRAGQVRLHRSAPVPCAG